MGGVTAAAQSTAAGFAQAGSSIAQAGSSIAQAGSSIKASLQWPVGSSSGGGGGGGGGIPGLSLQSLVRPLTGGGGSSGSKQASPASASAAAALVAVDEEAEGLAAADATGGGRVADWVGNGDVFGKAAPPLMKMPSTMSTASGDADVGRV